MPILLLSTYVMCNPTSWLPIKCYLILSYLIAVPGGGGRGFGCGEANLSMVDDGIIMPAYRIQAMRLNDEFDFTKLYNQTNEGNDASLSEFAGKQNACKYYTPVEFAQTFHQTAKLYRYFVYNSINARWDVIKDILYNIGLTEVFQITEHCNYMLHGYHHLEFKTHSDTDDAHGGIALLIKEHLNCVMIYLYSSRTS